MQVSIVHLSEIREQLNSRIDAEYWHPLLIKLDKRIQSKSIRLGSLIEKGYRVVYENTKILQKNEISENSPKFLQAADIESPIINIEKSGYVSNDDWLRYEKGRVTKGEILLEVKGNVKKVAIVPDDFPEKVLVSGTLYKFTVNSRVNKYFLVVYLSCNIGQKLKNRLISNIATPFISKSELYEIPVPLLNLELQSKIESIYLFLLKLRKKSESIFKEAENILLSELGLTNWQPKHQLTFIKNYSDTQQVGRIDAEYYQPKYDEIINAIKNYSGGWDTLGNLVHIKKCVEVGSGEYLDEGIPFVRVSNISPFEITEEKYISDTLYKELTPQEDNIPFEKSKNHQPQQGEILFSKDGTPGIAHYLKEEPEKIIPSGGILRVKSKTDKVNNEYLTLVLNSLLTQEQVNRDVGGSIILHWRPDQVREAVIPVLSEKKQSEIQKKVTESFDLRKQSKQLLEAAKKAVEIAIEQDEETAIKWLKSEIQNVGVTDASGL